METANDRMIPGALRAVCRPLWCVDTNRRAVFRLDPETGGILDAFGVAGPEAHGMTIHDGTFWMCDAETGEVFVLETIGQRGRRKLLVYDNGIAPIVRVCVRWSPSRRTIVAQPNIGEP